MKGAIVLGILLLIGSAVGAFFAFDQNPFAAKNGKKVEVADKPPGYILCWGHFDVEPGVAGLYPKQFGDVAMLVSENTSVKKGDILLQVDDRMARIKLEQATAVAKAAEGQYEEAKTLPKQYELQAVQQNAAIKALQHEIAKVRFDRDTKLLSLDKDSNLAKTTTELYKESLAQLDEKMKAEQAKLEQLKLMNAQLKIDEAKAEWDVKTAVVKEAREMLTHFKIVAPSDGMVLRVYVHEGETLGPNPRIQAIDFLPNSPVIVRAEVLQEWARFVKVGADVDVEDDSYNGPVWKGRVKSTGKWLAMTRSPTIEPFRFNDVRTLECIIELVGDNGSPKLIGQRVRAKIKI